MQLRISMSIVAVFAIATTALAQGAVVPLPATEYREFTSKVTGRRNAVYVSLPESYRAQTARRYPVLYGTDAHFQFPLIVSTYRYLRLTNEVPEMIIVGMAGADADSWISLRTAELTPTRVAASEQRISKALGREMQTGGAADLVRVFREELIPDIERKYRTADRAFVGHSFGGLFGTFALLQAPDLFPRLILVSPSLGWDGETMFAMEEKLAARNQDMRVEVFLAAGLLEPEGMIRNTRRMAAILESGKYKQLRVHSVLFDNEAHASVFMGAVTRGLRTLFPVSQK
jgi:uncharacterized protein